MKPLLAALLVVTAALVCRSGRAAEAAFSADGKHVYCLVVGKAVIVDISVKDKEAGDPEVIDLTDHFEKDARIVAISRIGEDKFMLATDRAIYNWKPGGKPEKIVAAPEDHHFTDVAMSSKPDILLAPSFLEHGEEQTDVLLCRRGKDEVLVSDEGLPTDVQSPLFDGDGRMFFGIDSTLYAGAWVSEQDEPPSLVAWPLTPLDVPSLDNGTSSDQLLITGITAAGKWLYVTLGSDIDAMFIRLPKPAIEVKGSKLDDLAGATRKQRWGRYAKALGTLEVIGSEDEPYFTSMRGLCTSPDGSSVFYAGTPMLHTEREEYWVRSVKSGEQTSLGSRPLEQ